MIHPIVKALTQARRSQTMSVLELADRTGYSESLLEKLECGHRTPSINSLSTWCEALDHELIVRRIEKVAPKIQVAP